MTSTATKPVALVTAASRGMGEGIARHLVANGWRVSLLARSDSVIELGRELNGLAMRGSVSDPGDLTRLVDHTYDRFGRIDGVVNNTGHPPRGDILSIEDREWHEALDLLVLNVIRTSRLVVPHMQRAGGGAFVNISTIGAVQPDVQHPVSAVLRSGLSGFTKLFANTYARTGLRMNNVLPGRIDSYPQTPERIAEIPAGRLGQVRDIATTVAFLLSPDAAYINGQDIIVDGGLVRGV